MSFFSPLSFFVEGCSSPDPQTRILHDTKNPTPLEWKRGYYRYGHIETPFYSSLVSNPKGWVIGATGINTLHLLNPNEVQKLNDAGISVMWVTLPLPHRDRNINDDAIDIVRAFLTDQNSPAVLEMNKTDVPKYLMTHSTSGRIALQLLHEDQTRPRLTAQFTRAVYIAPYLDTCNSSLLFNPIKSHIFTSVATMFPDQTPHETWFGRAYMELFGRQENYRQKEKESSTPLTYRQILALQEDSRTLIQSFDPEKASAIPSVFVVGGRDPYACTKTTLHFAKQMENAGIVLSSKAGHYPPKNDPTLIDSFVSAALEDWNSYQSKKTAVQIISHDDYNTYHRKPAQSIRPAPVIPLFPFLERLSGGPRIPA